MIRGSRKHVLDWTSQPRFLPELLASLQPAECRLGPASTWQPMGHRAPAEARLERFGPVALPGHGAWPALTTWWLRHARGANTPNWDIALSCEVEGRPGLVLVEAKANVPELSTAGKRQDFGVSERSAENHAQIGAAISEAQSALSSYVPGITIDRDRHYQLSNRLAFGWRLASLGVPIVLLYLGFTGDEGIRDVGEPFADDEHWQRVFRGHLMEVGAADLLSAPLDLGPAKLWVLSRSRLVLEQSPHPVLTIG